MTEEKHILVFTLKVDIETCKEYKYSKNCINSNMYNDISKSFQRRINKLPIDIIRKMYPFFSISEYNSYDDVPEYLFYDLGSIVIDYDLYADKESIDAFLENMFPIY